MNVFFFSFFQPTNYRDKASEEESRLSLYRYKTVGFGVVFLSLSFAFDVPKIKRCLDGFFGGRHCKRIYPWKSPIASDTQLYWRKSMRGKYWDRRSSEDENIASNVGPQKCGRLPDITICRFKYSLISVF